MWGTKKINTKKFFFQKILIVDFPRLTLFGLPSVIGTQYLPLTEVSHQCNLWTIRKWRIVLYFLFPNREENYFGFMASWWSSNRAKRRNFLPFLSHQSCHCLINSPPDQSMVSTSYWKGITSTTCNKRKRIFSMVGWGGGGGGSKSIWATYEARSWKNLWGIGWNDPPVDTCLWTIVCLLKFIFFWILQLSDFDVQRLIDHGDEGAVFLVTSKHDRHPNKSKLYALKVMFNVFQYKTVTKVCFALLISIVHYSFISKVLKWR